MDIAEVPGTDISGNNRESRIDPETIIQGFLDVCNGYQ